ENMGNVSQGYQIDINTITYFRREGCGNLILNMSRNLKTPSCKGLKNCCRNIPAIIVGSGPSLTKEIEKVKVMKDRAIIIAAGSSIQALQHSGLDPDLIVSIDAGAANRKVF